MKYKLKLSTNALVATVLLTWFNTVPAHGAGADQTCVLEFVPRSWFVAGNKKLYRLSRDGEELADVESRLHNWDYSESRRLWTKTRNVGRYRFQIEERINSRDLDIYRFYQVQNADLNGTTVLETVAGITVASMIFKRADGETLRVRIPYDGLRDFDDVLEDIVCIYLELKK